MRWPIRNQILLPFVGVLILAIAGTAMAAAYLAAKRSEEQTVARLHAVTETLADTNFPLTRSVLDKMRGLSGAHFVVRDDFARVSESTLPAAEDSPQVLNHLAGRGVASLALYEILTLGSEAYVAAEMPVQGRAGVTSLVVLYPESSLRHARWQAALPPLAIGAASLVFMIAVAFWLADRFSGRIRQVQQQVAAIAAGDFREIETGWRDDELRELVESVNQMCEQLRHMQQRIQQSERSQLLGQLAGGLAHQLRNAITGARLAVQIHERRCQVGRTSIRESRGPEAVDHQGSPVDAQRDESLEVALRQLSLTEEQVKGLLSLGRHERRPPQACDVGELVNDVARLVRPACQHARVDICHETTHTEDKIVGYSDELRAAVLNLTLNAIEAAGPGGSVGLRVYRENGSVSVEVSDTGPGPPKALEQTLFEPFVTGKPEGVGLGLALARQAATDHTGKLEWTRTEDRTVFRMILPVAPADS